MAKILVIAIITTLALLLNALALAQDEESITLGVQPQKYVDKCERSKVNTQLHTMDYAWTISGLANTFKFHGDQRRLRIDLETQFNTTGFPAQQILLKIQSCTNTSRPKMLSVAAFYQTANKDNLIMYKFNVAVNVGQNYLVPHEASSESDQEFVPSALLYNAEIRDQMDNSTSNFSSNSNNADDSSVLDCENGLDGGIISSYITSQSKAISPIDAITFIFKFTAIEYDNGLTVPMSTSQCGPAESTMTFDSLFGNGYGNF